MEQWDREYMDLEIPAFIRFLKEGSGEFQFGLVSGSLDCRSTLRQGKPAVEFIWEGQDERDSADSHRSQAL
jgi:hypothetical protein